jgi:hypothetical protein
MRCLCYVAFRCLFRSLIFTRQRETNRNSPVLQQTVVALYYIIFACFEVEKTFGALELAYMFVHSSTVCL